VELCKAALLYGDRVTLHSPNAVMLLGVQALAAIEPEDRLGVFVQMAPAMSAATETDALFGVYQDLLNLQARRHKSREELVMMMRLQTALDQA
jgi:hypothetical protein